MMPSLVIKHDPDFSQANATCLVCDTTSDGPVISSRFICIDCRTFFRNNSGSNLQCVLPIGWTEDSVGRAEIVSKCGHCRLVTCQRVGLRTRKSASHSMKKLKGNLKLPLSRCTSGQSTLSVTTPTPISISPTHSDAFVKPEWSLVPDSLQSWPDSFVPSSESQSMFCDTNTSPVSNNDSQIMFERVATTTSYLLQLNNYTPVILTAAMDPLQMWNIILLESFRPQLLGVSNFVRHLPLFKQLELKDRERLFARSFFPILVCSMTMNGNEKLELPNLLYVNEPESVATFKTFFTDISAMGSQIFQPASTIASTWKLTTLELGLFCGLLFFNPNAPDLECKRTVEKIHQCYKKSFLEAILFHIESERISESNLEDILFFFNYQVTPTFIEILRRLSQFLPESLNLNSDWYEINMLLEAVR